MLNDFMASPKSFTQSIRALRDVSVEDALQTHWRIECVNTENRLIETQDIHPKQSLAATVLHTSCTVLSSHIRASNKSQPGWRLTYLFVERRNASPPYPRWY